MLVEEMVVVGSVGLRLPELLLTLLPHSVHILGTGLIDGHAAMHQRGWRGGGGWRRIVVYHIPIGTSSSSGCLPASRSAAMAAISLWSVVHPSRRALEREEAMVGSSGVDRRKGTEADD